MHCFFFSLGVKDDILKEVNFIRYIHEQVRKREYFSHYVLLRTTFFTVSPSPSPFHCLYGSLTWKNLGVFKSRRTRQTGAARRRLLLVQLHLKTSRRRLCRQDAQQTSYCRNNGENASNC